MDGDKELTARFEPRIPNFYSLQTYGLGGEVSLSPKAVSYAPGTVVTVTATPNEYYTFVQWEGATPPTSSTATLTMGSDQQILQAIFQKQRYTLTINQNDTDGGRFTPASGQMHDAGEWIAIKATAAKNYKFHEWTVESGKAEIDSKDDSTTRVRLGSNATIRSNFAKIVKLEKIYATPGNYTHEFDKYPSSNLPATIEIYASGAGGGGQGGNCFQAGFMWVNQKCGTGGAGGGGAVAYMKLSVEEPVTFSIDVGRGGYGGSAHNDALGYIRSGYSGDDGGLTKVTWSGTLLSH
jgi:hypothetical protein